MYGYVDAQGQVHLANEKRDERYQLFSKGEPRREFQLSSELKYLPAPQALQDHIIFKRIQKTPNVGKFDLEEQKSILPSVGFDGFFMARMKRVGK